MKSAWWDGTKMPQFPQLNGDINTDVLIIGGGMAGILCAYFLDSMGADYVLAEASRIGCGISKNTTAKITYEHGLIYSEILKKGGIDKARMYLEANKNALQRYKDICRDMDCDFEEKDNYVYSMTDAEKIENEAEALLKLGIEADVVEHVPLPFNIEAAVRIKNQAEFNPLKFIASISKELNIYENTFIRSIDKHKALSDKGSITAGKIIVATHFPFINKHGSYFLKMYQDRSYVLALENAPDVHGMYIDENKSGFSFRNYKDLLFIGGSSHRTGKKGSGWEELCNFAKVNYPESKQKFTWATQDCMTLDHIPYIGLYSSKTPDLYVATGFNKWGMTSSMAAAEILSKMVMGKECSYAEVFSPQRSMMKPQLVVNGFEAAVNLMAFSKKRCPHLGCALKWNKAEHTWDCPCHGSRFSETGELIDNPATGPADIK